LTEELVKSTPWGTKQPAVKVPKKKGFAVFSFRYRYEVTKTDNGAGYEEQYLAITDTKNGRRAWTRIDGFSTKGLIKLECRQREEGRYIVCEYGSNDISRAEKRMKTMNLVTSSYIGHYMVTISSLGHYSEFEIALIPNEIIRGKKAG
jgi:hypothetical protein